MTERVDTSVQETSVISDWSDYTSFRPRCVQVSSDGNTVYYLQPSRDDSKPALFALDRNAPSSTRLVGSNDLSPNETISDVEKANRERLRLAAASGILSYELSPSGAFVIIPYSSTLWHFDPLSLVITPLDTPAGVANAQLSPDGNSVAYTCGSDVYITTGLLAIPTALRGSHRAAAVTMRAAADVIPSVRTVRLTDAATVTPRPPGPVWADVTAATSGSVAYGTAEFVAMEEMDRFKGMWWAPDSRSIAVQATYNGRVEDVHLHDPANPLAAPRSWPYPRPGHTNADVAVAVCSLGALLDGGDAIGGTHYPPAVWVDWSAVALDAGALRHASPITDANVAAAAAAVDNFSVEYLARVSWSDGAPLTLVLQNRSQTVNAVVIVPGTATAAGQPVDVATALLIASASSPADATATPVARVAVVFAEFDACYVDLQLTVGLPRWVPARDGALSLVWAGYHGPSGTAALLSVDVAACTYNSAAPRAGVVRPMTPVPEADAAIGDAGFGFRRLLHIAGGYAVVAASSMQTQCHIHVIDLAASGAAPVALTKVGVNDASVGGSLADGRLVVACYGSRVTPRAYEASVVDVALPLTTIPTAWAAAPVDASVACHEAPTVVLQEVAITVDGGVTVDVPCAVVRPRVAPGGRLPIVLYVYGGPGVSIVTEDRTRYFMPQYIADACGAVVVTFDVRGTPNRGRKWAVATYRDVITIPLRDQCAALAAAAGTAPLEDADIGRVGVYGWSFGGYFSAHAISQRPDVFRAAIAGAPVCDWAWYDTHYTERYLGTPEDEPAAYEHGNVVTHMGGMRGAGELLLVHGTVDDNVLIVHSLKMAEAALALGKQVDLVPLCGQAHGMGRSVAPMLRRMARHFKAWLG